MNVDLVLPLFRPFVNHGSFQHFHGLAQELARRGADVMIHTSNASAFSLHGPFGIWHANMRCGVTRADRFRIVRHRVGRHASLRMARELEAQAPMPEEAYRDEAAARAAVLSAAQRTLKADPGARKRIDILGPDLPARRIVSAARRRRAVIVTGYFPFRTCVDVAEEAARQKVPCWVTPLFHSLDPMHHNACLFSAVRQATGTLCLSPFAVRFFQEVLEQPRSILTGSAPPPLTTVPAPEHTAVPYAVFIGRPEHGKRLDDALRIIDEARYRTRRNWRLKVVAELSPAQAALLPSFADGVPGTTTWDIARLLAGAQALLFPSIHESFGIVAIEAARAGIPALTRSCNLATASILEAAGLGPLVYTGLSQAVEKLLEPPVAAVRAADLSPFTWDAVGAATFAALKETGCA